jgi:hypothetical protein
LNFDQVFYYDYKPKSKKEGLRRDNFERDSVKIVSVPSMGPTSRALARGGTKPEVI